MHDPRKAIELYRRAAELHGRDTPPGSPLVMNEEIADIQQFDLHDNAAAAATLDALRSLSATFSSRDELAAWYAWKNRWLDAEAKYLRTGKRFTGPLSPEQASGIVAQLYYGGAGALDFEISPGLNPYEPTQLTPQEIEKRLAALPASHGMFQLTWIFATQLPTATAARKWLERNDPGGFWMESLLTIAEAADRRAGTKTDSSDPIAMLVRTRDGRPTGFALLARERAKAPRATPR